MADRILHNLAETWFGEHYTLEKRKFNDGDERWIIKHSVGYSATDYVTVEFWTTLGQVIVKTIESDTEVHRARYTVDLQDRVI